MPRTKSWADHFREEDDRLTKEINEGLSSHLSVRRAPHEDRGLTPGKVYEVGIYHPKDEWTIARFTAEYVGYDEEISNGFIFKGEHGPIYVYTFGADVEFKEVGP